MLIAAIIVLIVLILAYIALNIYFLFFDKKDYEIRTKLNNLTIGCFHTLFIVFGLGMASLSIYIYAVQEINEGTIPFLYVGAGAGLFFLAFIWPFNSYFDAIKGDKVYIRRFFKIREINIRDIRTIDSRFDGSTYITEKNGFAFSVSNRALNREEFVKTISELKEGKTFSLNPNAPQSLNKEVEFSSSEEMLEKETLSDIGKRYRENYNLFRKKHIIKSNLIFFIFFSIFLGGSIALTILFKELICFVLLGLCLISLLIYCWLFPKYLKDLENELQHDDAWLGYKHRYHDKMVKGTAKKRRNRNLAFCLTLGLFGVFGCITTWFSGIQPGYVEKENLIQISGEFEYFRECFGTSDYKYAIGIKGDTTEYCINSREYMFFDKTFSNEVNKDTMLIISINPKDNSENVFYNGRNKQVHAYVIKTNEKDYLSYDGYVNAFMMDRQGAIIAFCICASIIPISISWAVIELVIHNKNSKKETIEL